MIVEIWGKPQCVYCVAAVNLCEEHGLEFTYKQYNVDFSKEEILAEFVGATTFPQIKVDGKPIGGYNQLEEIVCP